jgi:aerobic carbon-monoxide dehydrogenase large subunit
MRSARIGDSAPRLEDERLLRGKGRFLDDIDLGEATAHATFVRSPHAHARVRAVDGAHAAAARGVIAVWTAADVASLVKPIVADFAAPGFKVTARAALAAERVRFVGDALAMVLARDPYIAADAAELVELDLEPLAAVADAAAAVLTDAPRVHDGVDDNVLFEGAFESQGFGAVHSAAEHMLRERFTASRISAVPMEPRGCAARFDESSGVLMVWSSTQVPHMVQTCIAEHLGLRESDIRVVVPEVGGGFGAKAAVYPEELLVAAAAIRLRRPVKWVQDRYDDLLTSAQARDHSYDVEAGFTGQGILTSVYADILVNVGAYASLPFGSSLEANGGPRNMPGPYCLRHFKYRTRAVATNTCPTGAYRGVSGPIAFFVMEGIFDRIARRLGIDPAEVRRRNLVAQFPYTNVLGLEYPEGVFLPALERALELADYEGLRQRQKAHDGADGRVFGVGIAVVTEQTGMGAARYKARGLYRVPGFESASVRVESDGSITAAISQAAAGQGHATAFAQVVSEHLGAPMDAIRIVEGDTARTPFGTGTFASRGMVIAGNALSVAAVKVREKMSRIAANLLECGPADLEFRDGHAMVTGVPAMRVSLRDIASVAYSVGRHPPLPGEAHGLDATEYHDTPSAVIGSTVHVASVVVDRKTGRVLVEKYAVVHDCGRMVNPMLVDGQIQGATIQGLGEVLMEKVIYDGEAQPLTISLMEYQLPRCIDAMPMTIEALHSEAGAGTFKGVGESGIMAAVPALANAIGDALGVGVTRLPVTSRAILEEVRRA